MDNVFNQTTALTASNVCEAVNKECNVCDVIDNECENGFLKGGKLIPLIVVVYVFVFLVWGAYALFDFINERWKRMETMLNNGIVQLFFFMLTIPIAVYYIVVTASAEDYTEMSAAVVALAFSLYHVIRTIWGMIQLTILRRWVRLALQVMHFQGYHLCARPMLLHTNKKNADQIENVRELLTENQASQEEANGRRVDKIIRISLLNVKIGRFTTPRSTYKATLEKLIDHHAGNLVVNNSIVDNEFMDTENRFHLNGLSIYYKSEPLVCPKFLDQCFLRWSVVYLAYYGISFLQDSNYCRSLVYDLECSFENSFFVKCLLTQAMLIGNTHEERTSHQQATWESTWATIVLCRDEALFASLHDSSCMPSGKMEIDIQHGKYLNGLTHRLSHILDSLPLERFDLNLNHWKTVKLVQGMSCRDIENFAMFLHSSPLLSVDQSPLKHRIPVDRFSVTSFRFLWETMKVLTAPFRTFLKLIWSWFCKISKWLYNTFRTRQNDNAVDGGNPGSNQEQNELRDGEHSTNSDSHGSSEAVIDLRIGTSRFRNVSPSDPTGKIPKFLASCEVPSIFKFEYFSLNDQIVKHDFTAEDYEFFVQYSAAPSETHRKWLYRPPLRKSMRPRYTTLLSPETSSQGVRRTPSAGSSRSVEIDLSRNSDANPETSNNEQPPLPSPVQQPGSAVNISLETTTPPDRETTPPDVNTTGRQTQGESFESHKNKLRRQVHIESEIWDKDNISNLPTFWRCGKKLNTVQWNSSVPVVSVIIDNIYAVVSGNQYHNLLCESEQQKSVLKKKIISHDMKNAGSNQSETEEVVFEKRLSESNRLVQESVKESGLAGSDLSGVRSFQKLLFSKASMDNVLSIGTNGGGVPFTHLDTPMIFPNLNDPSLEIKFPASGMLQDAAKIILFKREPDSKVEKKDGIGERYALESRMIWECQKHLHAICPTTPMRKRELDSLCFALLLVLSFPALVTKITLADKDFSLSVEPLLAPQAVAVNIAFTDEFSHIQMKFTAPEKHNYLLNWSRGLDRPDTGNLILTEMPKQGTIERFEFKWKEWIIAHEGRMNAFDFEPDLQSLDKNITVEIIPKYSVIQQSSHTEEGSGEGGQEISSDVYTRPVFPDRVLSYNIIPQLHLPPPIFGPFSHI